MKFLLGIVEFIALMMVINGLFFGGDLGIPGLVLFIGSLLVGYYFHNKYY